MRRGVTERAIEPRRPRRLLTPRLILYIFLTLLGLYSFAEQRVPHYGLTEAGCRVGFVYDGDTVELLCSDETRRARLVGFDAPETDPPRCAAEAALGQAAKLRLGDLVSRGQSLPEGMLLDDQGADKYGRRLVVMRVQGRDVADVMIAEGLAVPYAGEARIDWCAHLAG